MNHSLGWLIELTWRGSLLFGAVAILDRLAVSGAVPVAPVWRRVWWLLAALGFLAPIPHRLAILPAGAGHPAAMMAAAGAQMAARVDAAAIALASASPGHHPAAAFPWFALWLGGTALYLALLGWQTARVSARWSRKRLSTDPRLLELLENCKETSGVTAPIGLVVSDEIATPALLGWLRPRILLPKAVAASFTPGELRGVLLHELAHFRHADVPANWLFAAVRALHWFNPLAHAAAHFWAQAREEAADAAALAWLGEPTGEAYGATVLRTLREREGIAGPLPYGALSISESNQNLKRRIKMIGSYSGKSGPAWVGIGAAVLLVAVAVALPGRAAEVDQDAEKKAALAAMMPWLTENDQGKYGQCWDEASAEFKKSVAKDTWVQVSKNAGAPLGACLQRKFASAFYQSGQVFIGKSGTPDRGTYVIAQFDSSFENMKYAVETVTFQKEDDGAWRASGYLIHFGL